MHTTQLDQNTEQALIHAAQKQGLSPESVIKNVLLDFLAEEQAIAKADGVYKAYLNGNVLAHNFNDVVRAWSGRLRF